MFLSCNKCYAGHPDQSGLTLLCEDCTSWDTAIDHLAKIHAKHAMGPVTVVPKFKRLTSGYGLDIFVGCCVCGATVEAGQYTIYTPLNLRAILLLTMDDLQRSGCRDGAAYAADFLLYIAGSVPRMSCQRCGRPTTIADRVLAGDVVFHKDCQ